MTLQLDPYGARTDNTETKGCAIFALMVRPAYAGGIGKGDVPEGYTNYRQKKNIESKGFSKRSARALPHDFDLLRPRVGHLRASPP